MKILQDVQALNISQLVDTLQQQKVLLEPTVNSVDKHLSNIKRYIDTHLKNCTLTPGVIAQATGISKRYLHKLFLNENISVTRYIRLQRLEECKRLLSDSTKQHITITEIAFDCGFGDISYFYRCFKSQYKFTPQQFRTHANSY